ncbi:serine/threonine protein kinase [Anopheles sinensis]|uniref:Serine/threonine protein kinase n=1 Tax=Anopheles sinensis TaxID=74873 RepID=A0A084W6B7_ANOSI|nr:serine/threonine protein kinase [Anopheles sinensis]
MPNKKTRAAQSKIEELTKPPTQLRHYRTQHKRQTASISIGKQGWTEPDRLDLIIERATTDRAAIVKGTDRSSFEGYPDKDRPLRMCSMGTAATPPKRANRSAASGPQTPFGVRLRFGPVTASSSKARSCPGRKTVRHPDRNRMEAATGRIWNPIVGKSCSGDEVGTGSGGIYQKLLSSPAPKPSRSRPIYG